MLKKFIRVVYLGIFFILTVISSYAMSIGPIYFNQRIDGAGGYQEYEIDNPSFGVKRYKIQVSPETSDKALKQEMKKWVEVYPKVLTIPPKGTGKIKLLIKASPKAKQGEYKFILEPIPITVPVLENKKSDSKLASVSLSASIQFSLGLNAYVGNLGDINRDLKIEKVETKDGLKIKTVNNLKREVALDILVINRKTRWRDLIKIKSGESFEKIYKEATKLEIKEAPTQLELKTIN
ncbi:hypothetical protein [Cetobacterium sp.]|uniref:hypothetical protein n=1 Tax=Cetobacterium sp. TaxID=2071632 RepID=UPI003F33F831